MANFCDTLYGALTVCRCNYVAVAAAYLLACLRLGFALYKSESTISGVRARCAAVASRESQPRTSRFLINLYCVSLSTFTSGNSAKNCFCPLPKIVDASD